MSDVEENILDDPVLKDIDKELANIEKANKSLRWKEVIDEDLREMERDLEKIKLPRSVKEKIMSDNNTSTDRDDELKRLDKEIEELSRPSRFTRPKVPSDLSSDEVDLKPRTYVKAEYSVEDNDLRALDKEIEELKQPKSLGIVRPKVTIEQYDEDGEENKDEDKREQSPFRVKRPIAPNYKLLTESDEEENIDAILAKRYQEPPDKKPGDTYKCRFCGLTYNYMTTLKAHERVHDVDEPYVCNRCGLSFRYYAELQCHSAEHKGEKGYKCECGRTFSKYTDLLNHAHPGEDDEPTEIQFGDEISAAKVPTYLKGYPDRRKSYYCQFCCKGYETSHELKYHLYSHRGERQFSIGSSGSRYLMNRI